MLKNHLLCLLLFACASSQAQFAPFPTPGLEHGGIYICNPWDCTSYFNFSNRYEGDTVLCGMTWNKFGQYVRAEQGKYYMRTSNCSEILLYDFSKNQGDTVLTGDLGALKVLEVGTFILDNGEVRKKMVLEPIQSGLVNSFTWVDGVGDINRGFLRAFDFEGGHSQLICVRDDSGMIYHTSSPYGPLDCDSLLCKIPKVAFDYSCSNQTYSFSNQSQNANSYFWDFGDGTSSTEAQPSHTYANPGCYNVVLKAKSACLPQEYMAYKSLAVNAPFFWKASSNAPPEAFKKMQFLDPQHGWALSDERIWKTSDAGAHWDTVPYPGPIRPASHLHFKDFEHGIISIFKPGPPYYYSDILWTDDGIHWELQALGGIVANPSITAIERLNDSVALVAALYQNLFITKNRGQSWETTQVPWYANLIEDIEYLGGDTVYFVGSNHLLWPNPTTVFGKTVDLQQWSAIEFTGIQFGQNLSFVNAQEGWMGTGSSVYHTTNGGQTWSQQLLAGITELQFIDAQHGWASGYSGVFGTKDGGSTWETQACVKAGEFMRGLNVFSPNDAYLLIEDGFYRYSAIPDILTNCEITSAATPVVAPQSLFSMYPNPSSGELHLQWSGPGSAPAEWVLYNAQGLEVLRWPGTQKEISIVDFPVGLYLVAAGALDGRRIGGMGKLVLMR